MGPPTDVSVANYRVRIARIWPAIYLLIAGFAVADLLRHFLGLSHSRYFFRIAPLFHLDGEQSVPMWFTASLIFGCAGLSFLHARHGPVGDRRAWHGLAAILTLVCLDEIFVFHENFSDLLHTVFRTDGLLYHAWTVPYGFALAALAFFCLRFWLRQRPPLRRSLLVGVIVYVVGAIGLEIIGSAFGQDPHATPLALCIVVEETLEMTGMAIALRGLAENLRLASLHFRLEATPPAARGISRPVVERETLAAVR